MQEKQHAWVFGASGLTGRSIVRGLCDVDIETSAHIRSGSSCLQRLQPEFEKLGANVACFDWSKPDIEAALAGQPPTVVFLSLGTTKARARQDGQDYRTVDYGLTKLVLDSVKSTYPRCAIVYVSSVRVMGRDWSDYFAIRTELEQIITKAQHPYLILRPSLIIGDRVDVRRWEARAAYLSDACLKGLSNLGLRGAAARYQSLSGHELGTGMVQLWLESEMCRIVYAGQLRSAAFRFERAVRTHRS